LPIRELSYNNFAYSVKFNVKSYVLTTTYQTKRNGKLKRVVYLDGPFSLSPLLTNKEAAVALRDEVFKVMNERSKLSTYEKYEYVQRSKA